MATTLYNIEEESQNIFIEKLKNAEQNEYLYILDWLTVKNTCYAVGISQKNNGALMKFKTKIQPTLYVWSKDLKTVTNLLVHATGLLNTTTRKITECNRGKLYHNNQATVIDELVQSGNEKKAWKMFAVPLQTFYGCKKLHTILNANQSTLRYISTTSCWNLEILVMLTMHAKYPTRDKIPIFSTLINEKLLYNDTVVYEPNLDVMIFDIETVSHEDHRLPMGDNTTDHISSITIVKYSTSKNIYELETIFNIPIKNQQELEKAKTIIENHNKPYKYIQKRNTEIVNTETSILRKTLKHFMDPRFNVFILLGFNSKYYDMSFLLRRASYLNMIEIDNFFYMHGIVTYGPKMIHIDMQQIIQKYYRGELSAFSLKVVAKELLEHTNKVDFNARNIRYIYNYFLETENINEGKFSSDICSNYVGVPWDIDLETLSYYNDMDSLIVLALWVELQYENFLLFVSREHFIPLSRIALTGVSEYLNINVIVEGLKLGILCTNHHNKQGIVTKNVHIKINLNKLASSTKVETAGYGGGFNYRCKKEHLKSVIAMDAQAYYPEIIAGFNLSHETTMLFTVDGLKQLRNIYPNMNFSIKIFRFSTHKNLTSEDDISNLDLLDNMSNKQYLFGFLDNGSEITIEDISKLPDDERLLIISKTPGLLSQLITKRNFVRNIAKSSKKTINGLIETTQEIYAQFEIEQAKLEAKNENEDQEENDEDDDDEEEEEEIDLAALEEDEKEIELKPFDINNYLIPQNSLSDEEYMVTQHYKTLGKKDFKYILNKCDAVNTYITFLKRDFVRINSQYRNMKLINNSIYGLLGSQYGVLKGKNIAAAATMIGRKYIIEAAKIGQRINCRCVYSDTDSVFFSSKNSIIKEPMKYIEQEFNKCNQHLILNSKIYHDIFIIAKKKYIARTETIFSRGINKNGPALWNEKIYNFYKKYICDETPIYMKDVYKILYDMYIETYAQIKQNPNLILCNMHIMDEDSYKTNTPAKKLIQRIRTEIPSYKFGNKIVYFNILKNIPTTTFLGLDIELLKTPLNEINLYQFYGKISKTLFDIISFRITETNKTRNVYTKYSATTFKHENLYAFIAANKTIS
ncbi:DNA polymerase [Dikerogammarus haemobaphes nudivirus]|nr:DNA polymerase [Dikerogammarus haemobaphes nudivirus]